MLVPGRLVGVEVRGGGPNVDRIRALDGRTLRSADAGKPVAVVESTFADIHGLPDEGRIRVAGRSTLRYVGRGTSPEYFIVSSSAGLSGSANYAVLFVPLETAQQLAGRPGRVNQLVLTLAPGSIRPAAQREVRQALTRSLPGVGVTVTPKRDEAAYHLLYTDAKNDRKLMNVFALLILLGAALAAFNLSSRVVEAERREIGVGMALGVPPRRLALRPLAMGAQIALLGVAFGIPIGLWIGSAMRGVLMSQLPLPIFRTPLRSVSSPAVPRSASCCRWWPRRCPSGVACGWRQSRRFASAFARQRARGWPFCCATYRFPAEALRRCRSATRCVRRDAR